MLTLLIDYDNVDVRDRRRGVTNLVLAALVALPSGSLVNGQRVSVRLYGGWFKGSQRSPKANLLRAELASASGTPMAIGNGRAVAKVLPSIALADALLVTPGKPILDTYRESPAKFGYLIQANVPYKQCAAPSTCSLAAVGEVIRASGCPVPGCTVCLHHVLTKPEQKLVDSMIVADLIELGRRQSGSIALISSDDDVLPGVIAAVTLGTRVFHLHSQSRRTPIHYSSLIPPKGYSEHIL